jgi:hypothetical protein
VTIARIRHQTGVRQNHGIGPHLHRRINRGAPFTDRACLRIRIDSKQNLSATAMGISDTLSDIAIAEIESAEIAGVRGIA